MYMTIRQAMEIQTAQLFMYRSSLGRDGVKKLRAMTTLPNINPDKPIFAGEVNHYIPRGGSFESIRRHIKPHHNGYDWHNAYRSSKIYSS